MLGEVRADGIVWESQKFDRKVPSSRLKRCGECCINPLSCTELTTSDVDEKMDRKKKNKRREDYIMQLLFFKFLFIFYYFFPVDLTRLSCCKFCLILSSGTSLGDVQPRALSTILSASTCPFSYVLGRNVPRVVKERLPCHPLMPRLYSLFFSFFFPAVSWYLKNVAQRCLFRGRRAVGDVKKF